jgi:hypothetical protein
LTWTWAQKYISFTDLEIHRQHRNHPWSTTAVIRIGGLKKGGLLIPHRSPDSTPIKSRWTNKGRQIWCACIKYEMKSVGIDLFPKKLGLQEERNRGRDAGEPDSLACARAQIHNDGGCKTTTEERD